MPILQRARNMLTNSPRNIKRRLFRDIFLILVCTSGAILLMGFLQGASTKKTISSMMISETTKLVRDRFNNIFTPTVQNLELIARWGQAGRINFAEPDELSTLLSPILEIHKDLASITLISSAGEQLFLYRRNGQVQSTYSDDETVQYGKSTWYDAALAQSLENPVAWTSLYDQPFLKEKAITAATGVYAKDGSVIGVAAFTITVGGVIQMVDAIAIPDNIEVLVLNKDGLTFSTSQNRDSWGVSATPVEEAGDYRSARDYAVQHWLSNDVAVNAPVNFRINGTDWWAGFSPLRNEVQLNWLAILLPESHIMDAVQDRWSNLGLIALGILLSGLCMAAVMVRKYSFQLKDLPQNAIRQESFLHDIAALIKAGESANAEFKSTVRKNLQTGKNGKEIELAWLKSVSAFMNSDGGIIIIGVNDNGTITGLEADEFANHDKCLLHCKNLLNTHIGAEVSRYIHVRIGTIEEMDIVAIECERVRRPVFLRVGKNEDFYIRSGPSSIKLTMSQMVKYLAER